MTYLPSIPKSTIERADGCECIIYDTLDLISSGLQSLQFQKFNNVNDAPYECRLFIEYDFDTAINEFLIDANLVLDDLSEDERNWLSSIKKN